MDEYRRALRERRDADDDYTRRFGSGIPKIGVGEEEVAWQRMKRAEAEVDRIRLALAETE
jgi:hypothetical protein